MSALEQEWRAFKMFGLATLAGTATLSLMIVGLQWAFGAWSPILPILVMSGTAGVALSPVLIVAYYAFRLP